MSGCVILLIDESADMNSKVARNSPGAPAGGAPAKAKSESVATSVNSLLNKLSQQSDVDIAIVGYRTGAGGAADIGARWGGGLAGRTFVKSQDLSSAPVTVERRVRNVAKPGMPREEQTIEFPIWYQPVLGEKAPQVAAFEFCQQLLASSNGDKQPLVIHISAGASSDGNPLKVVQSIQQSSSAGGPPLVMQAHLGSSDNVPATLYPANRAYLNPGPIRDFFEGSSVLPDPFVQVLKGQNTKVVPNARGMIFNASMLDLTRLLNLIHTHIQGDGAAPAVSRPAAPAISAPATSAPVAQAPATSATPPPLPTDASSPMAASSADETPATLGAVSRENPALVAFVLDRSLDSAQAGSAENSFTKLRDQLIDSCGVATKIGEGAIDVAIISYGADGAGQADVRSTLAGNLSGRSFARDDELLDGALRDESFTEERSNGVGGIMTVPHIRPILVELEPAQLAPMLPAFAQAAQVVASWCSEHPSPGVPPIVLHLTRGKAASNDAAAAAELIKSCRDGAGNACVLYHVVAADDDQPAVSYPDNPGDLASGELQQLWQLSSPLLCRHELSDENDAVKPESRGFVVNGKFNLLFDAIKRAKDA